MFILNVISFIEQASRNVGVFFSSDNQRNIPRLRTLVNALSSGDPRERAYAETRIAYTVGLRRITPDFSQLQDCFIKAAPAIVGLTSRNP